MPESLDADDRFGFSLANMGDLDGDGVVDLAVGASSDEAVPAGPGGAVYLLYLSNDGTVKSHVKIADGLAGFLPDGLENPDSFGSALANLGDLNGDGFTDLAVGAHFDENTEDLEGAAYVLFLEPASEIIGRHVFYDNSAFDTGGPPGDDAAIAPDKTPLLRGGTATFDDIISDSDGVTGIMIDVGGLSGTPTLADFSFAAGNDNDPSNWSASAAPTITFRPGAGDSGSDRIVLTWASGSIVGTWRQVTVNGNAGISLPTDTFYIGSTPGESGDSTSHAFVNGSDFIAARDNAGAAPVDNPFDYNRDGMVDGTDMAIARDFAIHVFSALRLISVPTPGPPAALLVTEEEQEQEATEKTEEQASPFPSVPPVQDESATIAKQQPIAGVAPAMPSSFDLILDDDLLETIVADLRR